MLICWLAGISAKDAAEKSKIKEAEGQAGSETYRIIVDNCLFLVSGV